MAISWTLPIRGVQWLFSLIVLGISAYLISKVPGSYSQANFMLFTSLWTFLVVIFLALADMGTLGDSGVVGIVSLALEFLTWVFWLSGWAALAAVLADIHCGGTDTYCTHLKADVAFGVMNWVFFSATLLFVAFTAMRGGSGGLRKRPGAPGGVA